MSPPFLTFLGVININGHSLINPCRYLSRISLFSYVQHSPEVNTLISTPKKSLTVIEWPLTMKDNENNKRGIPQNPHSIDSILGVPPKTRSETSESLPKLLESKSGKYLFKFRFFGPFEVIFIKYTCIGSNCCRQFLLSCFVKLHI